MAQKAKQLRPMVIDPAAPTVNDDITYGYLPGFLWFDYVASQLYICTSNANGAAVWTGVIITTYAPNTADFLVKTANGALTAERVVTDTASLIWDWSVAGQAKANVQDDTSTQKVSIGKNGSVIATRKIVNLIEGSNVTLTVADNAGNNRVDVTIASSGGGSSSTHRFSPVDWYVLNGTAPVSTAGNFTSGTAFRPTRAVRITGVRFYWNNAGGQTVNVSIWNTTDAAAQKTDSVVTSGIGYYTVTFGTPYDVPSNRVNEIHYCAMRDNAGAIYMVTTAASAKSTTDPSGFLSEPGWLFVNMASFAAGAAKPTGTAGGNRYPCEPVFDMTV